MSRWPPICLLILGTALCSRSAPPEDRIAVRLLARHYGFPTIEENDEGVRLQSRWTTLTFQSESRRLLFDNTLIWLHEPLRAIEGKWSLAPDDANRVIAPLLGARRLLTGRRALTVLLDPGHGGEDTGAIGKRLREKDAVLDIARRVRKRLQRRRLAVRLTRMDDYGLDLSARTDRARKWHADLFVSIHLNSADNKEARGVETYCLAAPGHASTNGGPAQAKRWPGNAFDKENTVLAHRIHRALLRSTGLTERGVRRARFEVLRDAPCPAVLVECGFVSNAAEERYIAGWRFRRRAAEGITLGIQEFVELTKPEAD